MRLNRPLLAKVVLHHTLYRAILMAGWAHFSAYICVASRPACPSVAPILAGGQNRAGENRAGDQESIFGWSKRVAVAKIKPTRARSFFRKQAKKSSPDASGKSTAHLFGFHLFSA